jgi:hypothetical protein
MNRFGQFGLVRHRYLSINITLLNNLGNALYAYRCLLKRYGFTPGLSRAIIEGVRSRTVSTMTKSGKVTLARWGPVADGLRSTRLCPYMKMLDLGRSRAVCEPIFTWSRIAPLSADE